MPETTTCTNPHRHSPFSLVGTFLHLSPVNMVRNNYLYQPTLPLYFIFGWFLSAPPPPSQHGQKQQPAPNHIATLLSLWLVPFCTPLQPTCQKQQPAPTHAATLLSLWLVPFYTLSPANMARNNYLHQPAMPLSFLFNWYLSAGLRVGGWGAARFLEERILDRLSLEPVEKRQDRYLFRSKYIS
jgi:hypothetical protein